MGEFNAICIVIKASSSRADPAVLYVINEIRAMLPKDSKNNFIVCATDKSLSSFSSDFHGVLQQLNLEHAPIVSFQNSAYDQLTKEPNEDDLRQMKWDFEKSKRGLNELVQKASKMSDYQSDGIKKIKEKRSKLKEEVLLMSREINNCTNAKGQLTTHASALKEAGTEVQRYSNFQRKIQV